MSGTGGRGRGAPRALRAVLAATLLVVGTSCTKVTVLGGLMVVMSTDGTLLPDALEVDIASPDGTNVYHGATYHIPAEAQLPTSIAIVSNGDPTASVSIDVSVWAAGMLLDVRQDRVLQVPTDRVAELDIVFSANCTPQVGLVNGGPMSKCAAEETCDPKSGSCVSSVVIGSTLPTFSPLDGGSPSGVVPTTDAGDATVAAADAGVPPSCLAGGPGLSQCGAAKSESCCASPEVAGGTFYRTYANDGTGATEESDPATVSAFRLDKYDVTVGRFRQFVSAVLPPDGGTGWTPAAGSGKHTHLNGGQGLVNSGENGGYEAGWIAADDTNIALTAGNLACDPAYATWTPSPAGNESLPINCVNWWESYAFCIWDGGFLPSETEWEYAAAGGSEQREYPWGATAPGTDSQYAIFACDYPNGSGSCAGVSNIAPVDAAPGGAGLWGQLDLAGNLWQRNLDWYATWADPCVDCAYLTPSAVRGSRGGDFGIDRSKLVPPYRGNDEPSPRTNVIGLRCARAPLGVCDPGATQCAGNSVQTCDSDGQWGGAVACSSPTPTCASGGCTVQPPSCTAGGPGMTNCGANHDESCCASPQVTSGTFFRTYDGAGGPDGGPTYPPSAPATVSTFLLDKYDVTVGRFRQFVNAWSEGWLPAAGSGKHAHLNAGQGLVDVSMPADAAAAYEPGWIGSDDVNVAPTNSNLGSCSPFSTWTNTPGTQEGLPINCVSWWESYAFCIWDGGFLPSEAEWEYAAAGGSQEREYPWGQEDPGTSNQYAIYQEYYPGPQMPGTMSLSNIAPVGSAPLGAGRWGQLDLAGNMWQPALDWGWIPYVEPCVDCAFLSLPGGVATHFRWIGGGSWDFDPSDLLPSSTGNDLSAGPARDIGLRCARSP